MSDKPWNLAQVLRIDHGQCVAIVGAGGKTTILFRLARNLAPAVVTTSTHLAASQDVLADRHILLYQDMDVSKLQLDDLDHEVVLITGPLNDSGTRLLAPSKNQLNHLNNYCKAKNIPFLIESDGSRRLSMKAPGEHEPAIPDFVDSVIVVSGLSNIGRPLTEENVHRPEVFARLGQISLGDVIDPLALAKVLLHPEGGLKNIPPDALKKLVLTQVNTDPEKSNGSQVAGLCANGFDSIILCDLYPGHGELHARNEKTSGIILAGGDSSRFGKNKLIEKYHGKAFVKNIAETALKAGLEPVVVVTGKDDLEIRKHLVGMPVQIVTNPDWQSGQSTSVKAGLKAMPRSIGGVIFLLGDQPQVSVELIHALMERHAKSLAPVVAPLIGGRRGNPVLFDRVSFNELSMLEGDSGGRQIFHNFQVDYLEWLDGKMLIDVDTLEDYDRLLRYDQEDGIA